METSVRPRRWSRVPLFYFHLHDNQGWIHDQEGRDIAADDIDEAALKEARDLIAADVQDGRPIYLNSFIVVDDASGREVLRLAFRDALDVR